MQWSHADSFSSEIGISFILQQDSDCLETIDLGWSGLAHDLLGSNVTFEASEKQRGVPLGVKRVYFVGLTKLLFVHDPLDDLPVAKIGSFVDWKITNFIFSVNDLMS